MEKNEQEFIRLVEKYKSTVYAVCYMFSDSKDELDDLFQEVLVKLWKGYGSFREESDIRTWIYRVSLNCCLNLQKRKKREAGHIPLSIDIDPFEGTSDRALQIRRLYARINRRVLEMVDAGLVEEVAGLSAYRHLPALQTVGYREIFQYLDGEISLDRAVELVQRNTRHYAKRQLAYWARDPEIRWIPAV